MEPRGAGRAPTRWASALLIACLLAGVPVLVPPSRGTSPGLAVSLPRVALRVDASFGPWDNGVTRLTLMDPLPSFYVSSDQEPRVASSHTLVRIAELTSAGNVKAFAPLQAGNVSWALSSHPVPGGSVIWLNASAPVVGSHGVWESSDDLKQSKTTWGAARVSFAFYLNASGGSGPNSVQFSLGVTRWPWLDTRDVLGLEIATFAVASTTLAVGGSTNSLVEVADGSRTTVATLSWDNEATVGYGSGSGSTSLVGTYSSVSGDALTSLVRLQFTAAQGGYSDLQYDPTVQLNPAAFHVVGLPAWIITQNALLTIAAATLLVGIMAFVALRSRSKPAPPP